MTKTTTTTKAATTPTVAARTRLNAIQKYRKESKRDRPTRSSVLSIHSVPKESIRVESAHAERFLSQIEGS